MVIDAITERNHFGFLTISR